MHQWIVGSSILLFIIDAVSYERRRDAFECNEICHQKCKVDSFDIPICHHLGLHFCICWFYFLPRWFHNRSGGAIRCGCTQIPRYDISIWHWIKHELLLKQTCLTFKSWLKFYRSSWWVLLKCRFQQRACMWYIVHMPYYDPEPRSSEWWWNWRRS